MNAAPLPSNTVEVLAPAKVNLFLRVLGPRPDGFHDLETLVLPLDLADRLWVHAFADPAQFTTLSLALELIGEPGLIRGVPVDESNLVLRAASALAERTGALGFAEITLEKHVPSAAGLGGGSSDAAATIRALDRLWSSGLDEAALREVAASVGSDVAALTVGGPVLALGRGEVVEPVAIGPLRWGLITQPFGVRSGDAFGWWDEDGGATVTDTETIGRVSRAARAGDLRALAASMANDLEPSVSRRHPEVGEARRRLMAGGALATVMCGSGPTVAGLFAEDAAIPVDAMEARSG